MSFEIAQKIKRGDVYTNNVTKRTLIVTRVQGTSSNFYVYGSLLDGNQTSEYFTKSYNHQSVEIITDKTIINKYKTALREYSKEKGMRTMRHVVAELGSDPEVFIVDKNNNMIPSFKFLKSKEEKATGITSLQNIFWDGFQAEFNIIAGSCLDSRVHSTSLGLSDLLDLAKKYDKDARLSVQTTFDIDQETLNTSAPEHVAFGCMPSLNIYGHEGMKADGRDVPFRSAGGHIHFGIDQLLKEETAKDRKILVGRIVKSLDAILGVACVSLFEKYDDPRRRLMYGLAGEYRLPKHGIEYRTLSNAWLSHPLIMNMVFELGRRALTVGYNDVLEFWNATEEETIHCINNCDVALSREILARNKTMFVNLLFSQCQDQEKAEQMYKIFMYGMDSIIKTADDIVGNWQLKNEWNNRGSWFNGAKIRNMETLTEYKPLKEDNSIEIYEQLVKDIQDVELGETVEVETADLVPRRTA